MALGVKLERYAQFGVQHHWLVDPQARRIECFRRAGAKFAELHVHADSTYPGFLKGHASGRCAGVSASG